MSDDKRSNLTLFQGGQSEEGQWRTRFEEELAKQPDETAPVKVSADTLKSFLDNYNASCDEFDSEIDLMQLHTVVTNLYELQYGDRTGPKIPINVELSEDVIDLFVNRMSDIIRKAMVKLHEEVEAVAASDGYGKGIDTDVDNISVFDSNGEGSKIHEIGKKEHAIKEMAKDAERVKAVITYIRGPVSEWER